MREVAVLFPAGRADGLFVTVSRAADAICNLNMARVALADTSMGFAVAVLRPLAPIVVKSGIRCGKRIGIVGAYFTTLAGQVIHCVIGAVRRRFQCVELDVQWQRYAHADMPA